MVFYRKYRPQKISELIGQEHIKSALQSALQSGKVAHAYLFAGPRGSGKTTTARILAKAINCEVNIRTAKKSTDELPSFNEPCNQCSACLAITNGSFLDLIEIDAASNRGIDDIRDLREKIRLAPTQGRYKVYIIDEAHMLTGEAFNALLKTLEEPPPHAVFILCTTLAEKLPVTIISRCTRFDFKKASLSDLEKALSLVADKEGVDISQEALLRIAQLADGSFRDALSLLDQLAARNTRIEVEHVNTLCALASVDTISQLVDYLIANQIDKAIILVNEVVNRGSDLKRFTEELVEYLRSMFFVANGLAEMVAHNYYSGDVLEKLKLQAQNWPQATIKKALRLFTQAANEVKNAVIAQLPLELAIAELIGDSSHNLQAVASASDNPSTSKNEGDVESGQQSRRKLPSSPLSTDEEKAKVPLATEKLESIEQKWPDLLKAVKKHNISVESLLRLAKPVSLVDNVMTLEVAYRFHKERIESAQVHNLINQVAREILGVGKLKVVCVLKPKKLTSAASVEDDLAQAVAEIFAN